VQIKLSNKDQGIFVFQLDQNNYIKFCPERGGVITNWVSDGTEILYFDEKRFMDKTKSIRGGIPILFPICGNLNTSISVFGIDYLQLTQHGFARDSQWQYSFNENKKSLCLFLNESKKTKKYYPFDFELRIEIICSLKRFFSSKEYLIPLTPRNGFSSLGKFKYGTCLSPPISKVLKTIVLENFVFNTLLISICSFNVGFEALSI